MERPRPGLLMERRISVTGAPFRKVGLRSRKAGGTWRQVRVVTRPATFLEGIMARGPARSAASEVSKVLGRYFLAAGCVHPAANCAFNRCRSTERQLQVF